MDYGQLSRDLVAAAIKNQMPGLTTTVVFHLITSQGDYDAETGEYADGVASTDPIPVVAARPSMQEVDALGVVATDMKLVVPGKLLTVAVDENSTCTMGGKKWNVTKRKDVPGGAVVLIFVRRT